MRKTQLSVVYDLEAPMHPLISLILVLARITSASISPLSQALELASNRTLEPIHLDTTSLHSNWPSLPLRHHIQGTLYIIITLCPPPEPSLQKDQILVDLITLEMEVTYGGNPNEPLPPVVLFNTEKVALTFLAEGTRTITRKQVKLVVHALWDLTFNYGPRAIGRASFEIGGVIVAHFVLNLFV